MSESEVRVAGWVSIGSDDGIDYRLVSRDDDTFWDGLATLLSESFDQESYRPVDRFRHLCPIGPEAAPAFYPRFLAAYHGDRLVAFAALEYFLAERVWYLWYMATAADMRGRGIGEQIVRIIVDVAADVFTQEGFETLGVIAECEAPHTGAQPDDDDVRRIAFYERHGFERLPVSELAPPFGVDETEPVPYWLLLRPVRPRPREGYGGFIPGWLRRMFQESVLNGPNAMSPGCEAFSTGTIGESPMSSDAMLTRWLEWRREAPEVPGIERDRDDLLNCTWLTPDAETHDIASRGYGEIAVRPIPAGSVVGILGGFVVNGEQLARMPEPRRHRSIEVDDDMYLVARELPEIGDLFNHSCEPTCGLQGSSLVVTMRDVEVGEELTFDYAMCDASDYDEFACLCGEASCRGVVTGSDWRDPVLQAKYDGWFSPYLVKRIAALPTL